MLRRFSVATAKAVVTQAAANDVQGAMRIAAQIPDFSPATCAQILSHPDCWSQLAPATEIAAKRELLDILVDNGQMPNAACMSPLLSALTKAQDYKGVIGLQETIKSMGIQMDTDCYDQLVRAHLSSGSQDDLTAAESLVQTMPPDMRKTQLIYAVLIYSATCTLEKEKLYNRMVEEGLTPTPGTYCRLFQSYQASKSFKKMKSLEESMTIPRTKAMYQYLLAWRLALGDDSILTVFREMKERGFSPRLQHYNLVMSYHAECGSFEEAEKLVTEMWKTRVHADAKNIALRIRCYKHSPKYLSNALELLERSRGSRDVRLKPTKDVYNAVLAACLHKARRDQDIDLAEKLYAQMKADLVTPDSETHVLMFSLYGRGAPQLANAVEKVETLLEDVLSTGSIAIRDIRVWNVMIRVYGMHGNVSACEDIWNRLSKGEIERVALNNATAVEMIKCYLFAERPDDASRIWECTQAPDWDLTGTSDNLLHMYVSELTKPNRDMICLHTAVDLLVRGSLGQGLPHRNIRPHRQTLHFVRARLEERLAFLSNLEDQKEVKSLISKIAALERAEV